MRSLLAVLGYLVIGATLTLAEQSHLAQTKGSSKNFLIAKCHFRNNGEVTFKEAENQYDRKVLAQTKQEDIDWDDEHDEDYEIDLDDDTEKAYNEDEDRKKKGCDKDPRISGKFEFKNLEKNTDYRLSVHEYNDLSKKCKYVGTFFNPRDLKYAPGVKVFKTDCNGNYNKKFKDLGLSLSTENSIINRSCVLEKIDKKCKTKPFKKCNNIIWRPPFFA